MLRYYFLTSWRNLRKNLGFSTINLIGQAIGLASCLLIFQYVIHELSYDDFHQDPGRLYRVTHSMKSEDGIVTTSAMTFSRVAYELKQTFTSVEDAVRVHKLFSSVKVQKGDEFFFENKVISADTGFLKMFAFKMLYGDASTALQKPNAIVLTASMAKKYFGSENAVGKELVMEGGYGFWTSEGLNDHVTYIVTGVMEDLPANTHFDFDFLVSLSLFTNLESELNNWGDDIYTYVKVKDDSQLDFLGAALPPIVEKYRPKKGVELGLQRVEDIHLHSNLLNEFKSNSSVSVLWILGSVAVLILIIASANYVNFATAQAIRRQREIALRKVFWARRSHLLAQVVVDTLCINAIAQVLCVALICIGSPLIKGILGFETFDIVLTPGFWGTAIGMLFIATLLGGIYPGIVIAGIAAKSISSELRPVMSGWMNKRTVLVSVQFTISAVVIGLTLVVFTQLNFMESKDPGLELKNKMVVYGPMVNRDNDSTYRAQLATFKMEVERIPGVSSVSSANFVPGREIKGKAAGYVRKVEDDESQAKNYYFSQVDFDFISDFQIKVLAGRNFDRNFPSDRGGVIINRSACSLLNFKSPEEAIGRKIVFRRQTQPVIIGVIEDFHQESLRKEFQPIIFELREHADAFVYISMDNQSPASVDKVRSAWQALFADSPFSHFYLNDFYRQQYRQDTNFAFIVQCFAFTAIFVAAIGLLGLVYYIALSKVKEIGIRKILGARFPDIFMILGKRLGTISMLSALLAIPVIYFVSNAWLQNYAFRTELRIWMVIAPWLVLLLVSAVVVYLQTFFTSRNNPVMALRER